MVADGAFSKMTPSAMFRRRKSGNGFRPKNNGNHHNHWSLTTALSTRSGSIDMSNRPSTSQAVPTTSTPSSIPAAALYMAGSMAFHLGGYEFLRSAGLTTFTSAFATAHSNRASIAFSLANVAVTPVSILCLWLYTRQIHQSGPRDTLRRSIASCILVILLVALPWWPTRLRPLCVAAAFVFQNTYVSLITSQQWSFLDSVVTPRQGAAWFGALTGLGSVAGTVTASLVPLLLLFTGIMGLYLWTAITLIGALFCADRAYATAAQHHPSFDQAVERDSLPVHGKNAVSSKNNSIRQAWKLVRRVPTLRALFVEGLVYQIFSTIVNFATLRALQLAHATDDARRSSLTGQFYAVLNGVSAVGQFLILPCLMKQLEVKQIWRCISILPFAATMLHGLAVFRSSNTIVNNVSLLSMLAAILFISQVTDYSIRSVICNVAYQPLDYESRYIGKEFIGVFANRLGRSGMSLFLTALTAIYGWRSHSVLDHRLMNMILAVLLATTCSLWMCSTWWLSRFVPTNAVAQQIVEERQK